jgi:transcriptional regulator with XRE-family HTH domain
MALAKYPNSIAAIERKIRKRFPSAAIAVDTPSRPNGLWFIDVNHQGHAVSLQWQQGRGFGITTDPGRSAYGERPHEVFVDDAGAFKRTVSLLLGHVSTSPPEYVRLRELRSLRGISQVELAEALDVQQAAISKIEGRKENILLSTLRSVIAAMGGELQLTAKFPDGVEKQLQFDEEPIPTEERLPRATASGGRRSDAK